MTSFSVQADAGEPRVDVELNVYSMSGPYVFLTLGDGCEFTSQDPDYCRRVASAWDRAAELLETFRQPIRQPEADAEMEPGS